MGSDLSGVERRKLLELGCPGLAWLLSQPLSTRPAVAFHSAVVHLSPYCDKRASPLAWPPELETTWTPCPTCLRQEDVWCDLTDVGADVVAIADALDRAEMHLNAPATTRASVGYAERYLGQALNGFGLAGELAWDGLQVAYDPRNAAWLPAQRDVLTARIADARSRFREQYAAQNERTGAQDWTYLFVLDAVSTLTRDGSSAGLRSLLVAFDWVAGDPRHDKWRVVRLPSTWVHTPWFIRADPSLCAVLAPTPGLAGVELWRAFGVAYQGGLISADAALDVAQELVRPSPVKVAGSV
jgi:hypothetical protein